MRLRKAESRFIGITFIILLSVTLVLSQCIFCVPAQAYAQEEGYSYSELIPDYVVFRNPSAIAAGGGLVAVFDEGEVYIIDGDTVTSFDSGVTSCDELCVSEAGVFLLVDEDSSEPNILSFSLTEKAPFDAPWSGEIASDMALDEDAFYFASNSAAIHKYDLQGGGSSVISIEKKALYLAVDEGNLYYQTSKGAIRKKEDSEKELLSLGISESFAVENDAIYYVNGDDVWKADKEGTKSLFLQGGSSSGLFSSVVDLAVYDGKLYLTDGVDHAVKIFDLSTRELLKTIGSYGDEPGRLRDPVALDVKGGKIAVADSARGTIFSSESVALLSGALSAPTDVVIAGDWIYLVDEGKLSKYNVNAELVKTDEYRIGSGACRFVTAGADGTIYAGVGNAVYRKNGMNFELFLTATAEVTGLQVDLGGERLYVLAGDTLSVYTADKRCLATLDLSVDVAAFAVDYRGNLFCLSEGGSLLKFTRALNGYTDPVTYESIAPKYRLFRDIAIAEDGRCYVLADHNVLLYEKETFGVFVAEDSTAYADNTPDEERLFVCEVTKDSVISYMQPDSFDDLVPAGTKLLCYATVYYQGVTYLRVETEKGKAYLTKSDVKIYEPGAAPVKAARCLIPAEGVNVYKEPSHFAVERKEEPLFASLGKEAVFDVISYVAVDEEGKDAWGFYWVSYQDVKGYVLTKKVVSVDNEPTPAPPTYSARIKSEGLGKTVPLYREASADSEVVVRLTDGTEISLLEPIDKDKEFIMVLYNGEVCYVQSACLGQGGLSGGQILAIVLSVAAVLGSVLTVLILRANKRHKRYHKE